MKSFALITTIAALYFGLAVSLATAAPTTQPTTAPATRPTTLPTTSPAPRPLDLIGGIKVSHAGVMAPETVHVDVMTTDGKPAADRYLHYLWDFGDAAGRYKKYNQIPAGWCAAHLYESPGPYVVSCTVSDDNGRYKLFRLPINVAPDTRKHVKVSTYAEAFAACAADTYVEVAPGSKIDPQGQPSLRLVYRNLVLDGFGSAELHCNSATSQILSTWAGETQDVLVRGFTFVSDLEDDSASMGQARKSFKGWPGWIRGQGNTFADCKIDHTNEGIQLDTNVSYCLLQDVETVDAWSVTNSNYWIQGTSIVELGCIGRGSRFENVKRCADFGLHRGLCYMGQYTCPPELTSPPFMFKCPNTMRTVSDSCVAWCHFTGHWIEFCPRSEEVEVRNVQFQWNTLNDCHLSVQAPVHNALIRNNTIITDNVPIVFTMHRGTADVDGIETHNNTVITRKPRGLTNIPPNTLELKAYSEIGVTFSAPATQPTTQPSK